NVRDRLHRHAAPQGAGGAAQRRPACRRREGRLRPERHHRERAAPVPAPPRGPGRERRRSGPGQLGAAGGRRGGRLRRAAAQRDALMRWLVEKALAAPFMVVALAAGLLGLGLWCYTRMDIEAYPNPVAPMIEVITQPAGWSAEEVERYVTIPLENGLAGMIDLEHIRSQSLFGLSDVKCYFSWNPEYHTAQQRVVNRLQFIQLPPGLQPQLSPWSAIGEIFRYTVKGPGYSLAEQSFNVRGLGLIRSLDDIGQIVLAQPKAGTPVRVRDVAQVREGAAPRLGIVGKDLDPDVVQGIVLMRYGGSSLETLKGVHERVELIRKNHVLPIGMEIEPYYDRDKLVKLTTDTVLENLLVGMLLVTVVLWVFLGQARAAAVAAVNIPLAL